MVRKHVVIRWHTTPDELRKIADRMDRLWGESCIGSNIIAGFFPGDGMELRIIIDQERMQNNGSLDNEELSN